MEIGAGFDRMSGVRKWVSIGAIAVVVVGLAAWVFWEPEKGTLEWHKRKYRNPTETTIWDRLARLPVVPAVFQRQYEQRKLKILEFHERELIKAGALKESQWALTNGWPPVLRLSRCGLGHAE